MLSSASFLGCAALCTVAEAAEAAGDTLSLAKLAALAGKEVRVLLLYALYTHADD